MSESDLEPLAEAVVNRLLARKESLVLAESCTGGLISRHITRISGASGALWAGLTVYSNEAKEKILGVPRSVLEAWGAVSSQTAESLLQGSLALAGTSWAAAVTGIAGPLGGTAQKPVGLVYLGLARDSDLWVWQRNFSGSRDEIQCQAAGDLLTELLKLLEEES